MSKKKSQTRAKRRKNEVKKIDSVGNMDMEIWGKVLIAVGVVAFLLFFYLLTIYITNKHSDEDKSDKSTKTETTISYNNIPLGRSFSMSDDDYYVLYYDAENEDTSKIYEELKTTYNGKEDHLKLYTVNMGSGINASHATSEESNKSPGNASELSINGPTLIKISNHAVSEYYEGEADIKDQLG